MYDLGSYGLFRESSSLSIGTFFNGENMNQKLKLQTIFDIIQQNYQDNKEIYDYNIVISEKGESDNYTVISDCPIKIVCINHNEKIIYLIKIEDGDSGFLTLNNLIKEIIDEQERSEIFDYDLITAEFSELQNDLKKCINDINPVKGDRIIINSDDSLIDEDLIKYMEFTSFAINPDDNEIRLYINENIDLPEEIDNE